MTQTRSRHAAAGEEVGRFVVASSRSGQDKSPVHHQIRMEIDWTNSIQWLPQLWYSVGLLVGQSCLSTFSEFEVTKTPVKPNCVKEEKLFVVPEFLQTLGAMSQCTTEPHSARVKWEKTTFPIKTTTLVLCPLFFLLKQKQKQKNICKKQKKKNGIAQWHTE